jgi:hypothetical protein
MMVKLRCKKLMVIKKVWRNRDKALSVNGGWNAPVIMRLSARPKRFIGMRKLLKRKPRRAQTMAPTGN